MSGSFFLLGSRIWISRLHRQRASAAMERKVTRQSLLTLRASLPCPETTTASASDSTDVSELLSDAQHPSPTSASVSRTRAQARFNFQRCRTNFRSHSFGVTFRAAFAPCPKKHLADRAHASTTGALTFHENMDSLECTHLSPPHIDEPNANHFARTTEFSINNVRAV